MPKKYNSELRNLARELRNNMTKEERHLWYDFLRNLKMNVSRQEIMGKYIVDFYIAEINLAIEVDGGQHYEAEGLKKDQERTRYLEDTYGVEIVRIQNTDVNENFDGVCEYLEEIIKRRSRNLLALPAGRGGAGVR